MTGRSEPAPAPMRALREQPPSATNGAAAVDREEEVAPRGEHDRAGLEPVYVWDLVVRATHWLIVASIVVLSLTGIYIARPFLLAEGEAGQRFVMGTVKAIHYYGAIVFSLAVMARLIWMFTGTRYARWRQFVPVAASRRRGLIDTFLFYIMVKPRPPEFAGHNPLAGLTYVAVFFLYLVMIFTGFALYSTGAYTSYMGWWDWLLPIFGGPQATRWIHHVVMWLLIGFSVHHVFSALLVSRVEKNGTLDSIFSGYKFLRRDRKDDDA